MAYAIVVLKRSPCDSYIKIPLGFSWVNLFTGFISPWFSKKNMVTAIVMYAATILTLGMFNIANAFLCNKRDLKRSLKKGYRIDSILSTDNEELPNIQLVGYYRPRNKYYVWVDIFGIEYQKYFNSTQAVIEYISSNPCSCSRLKYYFRALERIEIEGHSINTRYELPIQKWLKETEQITK